MQYSVLNPPAQKQLGIVVLNNSCYNVCYGGLTVGKLHIFRSHTYGEMT